MRSIVALNVTFEPPGVDTAKASIPPPPPPPTPLLRLPLMFPPLVGAALALIGVHSTVWSNGDDDDEDASKVALVSMLRCRSGCGDGCCCCSGPDDDNDDWSPFANGMLSSSLSATLSRVDRGTERGAAGDDGNDGNVTPLLSVVGVPSTTTGTAAMGED